jgi:PPOX class probable F420-dependent enzyme
MASTLDALGAAQYVLVTTYRRDGTAVPTPVWVVRDGGALAIWTPTSSGKVKRIRRNPAVLVATCDFRGGSVGEQVPGRASVLDAEATERVRALLRRKYGLVGWLSVAGSRLRRGRAGTVGIAIWLGETRLGEDGAGEPRTNR